jgi:hypothetical protein
MMVNFILGDGKPKIYHTKLPKMVGDIKFLHKNTFIKANLLKIEEMVLE